MINGSPEIASLAVDANKDLIQVPSPLDVLVSRRSLPLSEFGGKDRSETVSPEADGLVADINTPFVQQIFNLAQR